MDVTLIITVKYIMSGRYRFGSFLLKESQIFYESEHCFASVNIRPVVAGHSLIISKSCVSRIRDLQPAELSDIMISAQKVSKMLEDKHGVTSCTFCIQDGVDAGQTVPHVHMHVLPRRVGDFKNNDDIYTEIEKKYVQDSSKEERLPLDSGSKSKLWTDVQMKDEAQDNRVRMKSFL